MPTPTDPKRLPRLKAALKRFGDDDRISHKDAAKLYGVAPARFTTLIKARFPEFPAAERHEDKTHWYAARAAAQSMIAYCQGAGAKAQAANARANVILNRVAEDVAAAPPPPPEPVVMPMSAAEIDRMASAETRIWRLAKEKGQYVPRADVEALAQRFLSALPRGIMQFPSRVDPNGTLPPNIRKSLERSCRDLTLELHEILADFVKSDEYDADPRSSEPIQARA